MYFERTQAFVSFSTGSGSAGKPQLTSRTWLSCHHCRNVVEVIGPSIILELERKRMTQVMRREITEFTPMMLQEFVYRQVAVLRAHRSCEDCGSISALPRAHIESAEKELARMITLDWLNAQIDSLMMCVPFRAKLEADESERLAIETSKTYERLAIAPASTP